MKRLSFMLAMILATLRCRVRADSGRQHHRRCQGRTGRRAAQSSHVSAQGLDATQTLSTESTGEHRLLNLAPGPYKITATLSGFGTIVRENVIVAVGRSVELPMTLKVAPVAETITVSGESPVVDTKATGTSTNFTSDELTKAIPTCATRSR